MIESLIKVVDNVVVQGYVRKGYSMLCFESRSLKLKKKIRNITGK